jgi:predicted glycoside hydrolase/deacetylase ChbG (UPF0249 family)
MIQLIINADDFGLSRSVNQGIIQAHCEGILTSTTIMANMPYFEEAANLAHQHTDLGVGVHLNIIRGTPLSDPMKVPSLIDNRCFFFNHISKFMFRLFLGRLNPEEIRTEYRAQIERVIENGLRPTHIDSEKHHHLLPGLLPIVVELAKYYHIQKIRLIDERPFLYFSPANFINVQYPKATLLSLLSQRYQQQLLKEGIITVDKFYGISVSRRMTLDGVINFLKRLDGGIFEFMCHPGLPEATLQTSADQGKYFITRSRPLELKILLNEQLKEIIRQRQINLVHYGEI